MIAYWLLMAAVIGASVGFCIVNTQRSNRRAFLAGVASVIPADESALLKAANARVVVRDEHIRVLSTMTVAPAEMWSLLPWQEVPSRAEVTTMQALADHNQFLEAELNMMGELLAGAAAGWAKADATRQRHWNLVKSLRVRLAAMVPVEEFEAVEDRRARSLSVARSAASRAADRAAVITEIEVARIEAMDLEAFNEQFEQILAEHGIEVSA